MASRKYSGPSLDMTEQHITERPEIVSEWACPHCEYTATDERDVRRHITTEDDAAHEGRHGQDMTAAVIALDANGDEMREYRPNAEALGGEVGKMSTVKINELNMIKLKELYEAEQEYKQMNKRQREAVDMIAEAPLEKISAMDEDSTYLYNIKSQKKQVIQYRIIVIHGKERRVVDNADKRSYESLRERAQDVADEIARNPLYSNSDELDVDENSGYIGNAKNSYINAIYDRMHQIYSDVLVNTDFDTESIGENQTEDESIESWRDEETLKRLYHDEGLTLYEIGERLGCTDTTVATWMEKYGIERRGRGESHTECKDKLWRDEETLQEMYVAKGMTLEEVANELGCSRKTVTNWLHKHDIPIETGCPELKNAELLHDMYHRQDMSLGEIADEVGVVDHTTVMRAMDKHGIDRQCDSNDSDIPNPSPAIADGGDVKTIPVREIEHLREKIELVEEFTEEDASGVAARIGSMVDELLEGE